MKTGTKKYQVENKIKSLEVGQKFNKTNNRLFTKEQVIAFALYAPNFEDIKVKKAYLEDHFETWAFISE
jgi:hypothetical protein